MIDPLIKVMNLVAVLIAPATIEFSVGEDDNSGAPRGDRDRRSSLIIVAAVIVSQVPRGLDGRGARCGKGPVANPV